MTAKRIVTGLFLVLALAAAKPNHKAPDPLAERIKAAKTGDALAQFTLGEDLREGRGVPKDSVQAYKWIHLAAVNNLADAQFTVGEMDAAGEGTTKRSADALDWFRKASKQGHLGATLALARMLKEGIGGPVDLAGAVRFYRVAADHNDLGSQLVMGYSTLHGWGVNKSANDAAFWFRRAAQSGNAEARHRLALILLDGDPAQHSSHRPSRQTLEAAEWLRLAADQGYAPAQYALGMAMLGDIACSYDRDEIYGLIAQAADQGYGPALRKLANFFESGRITGKDPQRALMYLELASQLGDWRARSERDRLAKEVGQGPQQNAKKRAQEWLQSRGL